MNVPLVVAGSLSLVGAAIHGGFGDALVVRKLSLEALPASPFGGPRMTKLMIRVAWHLATIGFAAAGLALLLSGSVLHGDTARGIATFGAAASTAFAALMVGASMAQLPRARSARQLRVFVHPGPILGVVVTVLAWVGVA